MENHPTRGRRPLRRQESDDLWSLDDRATAIRFMVSVINATICSSGEDYDGALEEFFPQLQALGHLIGARDLDEVSLYLRRYCRVG